MENSRPWCVAHTTDVTLAPKALRRRMAPKNGDAGGAASPFTGSLVHWFTGSQAQYREVPAQREVAVQVGFVGSCLVALAPSILRVQAGVSFLRIFASYFGSLKKG